MELDNKKVFTRALIASTLLWSPVALSTINVTTDVGTTQNFSFNHKTINVSPGANDGGSIVVSGPNNAIFGDLFTVIGNVYSTKSTLPGGFSVKSHDGDAINIITNASDPTVNIFENAKVATTGSGHVITMAVNANPYGNINNSGELTAFGSGKIIAATGLVNLTNNAKGIMTGALNQTVVDFALVPFAGTYSSIINGGKIIASGTGVAIQSLSDITNGITNTGTISADSTLGTAIDVSNIGDAKIKNSGTISGFTAIKTQSDITQTAGSINGNIIVNTSAPTITVTAGSMNGNITQTTPGQGLEINVNPSNVNVPVTITGDITGLAAFASDLKLTTPGQLNLTGNLSNMNLNLPNGGTVTFNGNMSTDGSINMADGTSNTTLKLSKMVNVPNALNMNGLNSRLQLTLNDKTNFSGINAAGVATLNGNIQVSIGSGYIFNNDSFKIIQAAGNVVNNGVTFTLPNSALLAFTSTVNPNDVTLAVSRRSISSVANTNPVAAPIAVEMDRLADGFTAPGYVSALRALESLTSNQQVIDALVQLAPRTDGATLRGVTGAQHLAHDTITHRLSLARNAQDTQETGYTAGNTTPIMIWLQAYGNSANQDVRKFVPGYRAKTLGAAFGADSNATDNLRLGLSFNHGTTNTRTKLIPTTSNQIQSWGGSVYGSYEYPCSYVDAIISYASNMYHTVRRIQFATTNQQMDSDHRGNQISARLTYGKPILQKLDEEGWSADASVSASWDRVKERSFTERNLTGLVLRVNRVINNSAMLTAMSKLDYYYTTELGTLVPSFKVGASYDVISQQPNVVAAFMPTGAQFRTLGAKRSRLGANLGFGATLLNNNHTKIDLSYDVESRRNYLSHTGLFTVRYEY